MKWDQLSRQSQKELVEIDAEAPLSQALAAMTRHRVHHLIVKRNQAILGVTSYRSFLECQLHRGFVSLAELRVNEALDEEVPRVDVHFDLRQALRVVLDKNHSALLVHDGGEVVGLVTTTDLLRALDRLLQEPTVAESVQSRIESFLALPLVQAISRLVGEAGV